VRRIVVMCRLPHAGALARGRKYLERARALTRRAEALGAELVSWGAASIAFSWDPELVEETISFVQGLRDSSVGEMAWSCAISEGDMEPLGEGASRATLAWGEALLRVFSLARIAQPGEVLVDERVSASPHLSLGAVRVGREAGLDVRGAVLDLQRPWQPVVEMPSATPLRVAERTLELVRHAVRSNAAREALAARMHAIARLNRGEVAEALASLEKVRADSAGQPRIVQCQASLALAVALLAAGLPDQALLEALDALAHARASSDLRSAGACLAFLAKLFAKVGRRHDAEKIALELAKLPRASMPSMSPISGM